MEIEPEAIMGAVVALIILAVGVFAFFVTIQSIPVTNIEAEEVIQEIADSGNSVFNLVGVVLIIGAIMSILGLVYHFVDEDNRPPRKERPPRKDKVKKVRGFDEFN